jgi:Skp family chaperone for outer membrane proteins
MRRLALLAAALVAAAVPLAAQQVTKVGICDLTRVLSTAYRQAKGFRDFEAAQNDVKKEIASVSKTITDLQNQQLDADKTGNKTQSLKLQAQITDQQTYLDNYRKVKTAWLQQQYANLLQGPVLQDILDVVKFVADAGGFSLIIRSDDIGGQLILYNVSEIDITDQVIAEVYNRAGQKAPGTGQ